MSIAVPRVHNQTRESHRQKFYDVERLVSCGGATLHRRPQLLVDTHRKYTLTRCSSDAEWSTLPLQKGQHTYGQRQPHLRFR